MKIPYRFADIPRETEATHLINVFMPLPFSVGKNTFLVDKVDITSDTVTASLKGEMIVTFPTSYQYMVINLKQYKILSDEELEAEEQKFKEEAESIDRGGDVIPLAGYR